MCDVTLIMTMCDVTLIMTMCDVTLIKVQNREHPGEYLHHTSLSKWNQNKQYSNTVTFAYNVEHSLSYSYIYGFSKYKYTFTYNYV